MSNNSSNTFVTPCFKSKEALVSFAAVSITILLLVFPVFIYVLHLGCQKWRQQCSTSTPMSLFDVFLCHSFALDVISVLGYTLLFFGDYFNHEILLVGGCSGIVASFGKDLLHVLTSVDRYLAVVKPITYQRLRETCGVRIRNISTGCVWLLSIIHLIVVLLSNREVCMMLYLCMRSFFIFVISFNNISLLCLLKHPGLLGLSGNRQRVNQSKRRAFKIIMAIMWALLFKLGGYLIIFVIAVFIRPRYSGFCTVKFLTFFLELPSSLTLPLLFLQGAGKLQWSEKTSESG